ncbi:M24 family metallopeptidase [Staphylococcus cohnii]|uniref:Aminopeptidase YpdF n=2 Tax=Staphylococcus TaxID=1279 RepID=A0A0M2NYG9_STACC|nr:Xaa-Pro peptidase family protein [Staphylococcus cohnii]KKI62990.1 Aminopeptidase YpdF [Staphylococcus cohnii subsp. cohnii]
MYNINGLKNMFEELNYDTYIATTKENIQYLSGFSPVCKVLRPYTSDVFVIVNKNAPDKIHIVHSKGEIDQVLDSYSDVGLVNTYGDFYREDENKCEKSVEDIKLEELSIESNNYSNAIDGLQDILEKLNSKKILIDEEGLNHSKYKVIAEQLSSYEIKDASYYLKKVRSIKTDYEIKMLQKSSNVLEQAILDVADLNLPTNEDKIVKTFNTSIAKNGGISNLPMIKVGKSSVGGQRKPNKNNTFHENDFVWFDCDISYKGYWSDVARILTINKDTYINKKYYSILLNAQKKAIDFIKPGMKAKEVYKFVMDHVRKNGIPHYKRQHVGHGIGLEPYELPVLSPDNEEVIEENMVLCIETPYYEYGVGAIHVEDLVVIQKNKNVVLNKTSGDIIEKDAD